MNEVYEAEGKSDLPCDLEDIIWRVQIIRENELVPAKELLQFGLADNAAISVPTEIGPECISFFTDGSGDFQNDSDARLSAWSVVMCRGNLEQCVVHFRQMRATRKIPPCFQVVATSQTSGEQSVPRAELEAVVTALEAYRGQQFTLIVRALSRSGKQEEPGNPKANQPHSPWHVDPVVFRLKGPKANQDLSCSQLGNQPQNR